MGKLVEYLTGLRCGDEIDGEIADTLTLNIPWVIGSSHDLVYMYISNNRYNFVYVPWAERKICCGQAYTLQDIISRRFSGCYLSRIVGSGSHCYCYHIHKDQNLALDQKKNWNSLIEHLGFLCDEDNSILYKPNTNLVNPFEGIEYWGIISDTGDCFTVVVKKQMNPVRFIFRAIANEPKSASLLIP